MSSFCGWKVGINQRENNKTALGSDDFVRWKKKNAVDPTVI